MKIATLVLPIRDDVVLLGFKKKGEIGSKTVNGPGGKLEPGETLRECAARETMEEVGLVIDPIALDHRAIITFYHGDAPDFLVHVYRVESPEGEPVETLDMIPAWYPVSSLPYNLMLESDRTWFEKAITGERFSANVYYEERASGFKRIEFLPYEPEPV